MGSGMYKLAMVEVKLRRYLGDAPPLASAAHLASPNQLPSSIMNTYHHLYLCYVGLYSVFSVKLSRAVTKICILNTR